MYKALIIDDEKPVHAAISALGNFREHHIQPPYSAYNGKDGLSAMRELRPDIVFFNEPAPNYALLENILNKTDILVVIGTSGQVLNINKMATRVSFSLFSTLEQSSVVNDTLFDDVIYGKATETIDSIIEIIENKLIVHS